MRYVLAFDTATEECAVGLGTWPEKGAGAPEVLGELNLDVPRAALTHLAPSILRLLEACGIDVREIGGVVAGRGPGSFTGVRIGVATAKGISQGLGAPLWGVGTLDGVAERFRGRDGLVAVVGDAMRREVYPALFRCGEAGVERLWPDRVMSPADAAALIADTVGDDAVLLTGNGLRKYRDVFVDRLGGRAEVAEPDEWTPTGAGLLSAAWHGDVVCGAGEPQALLPIYTRLSDAEENERGGATPPPATGVAGPSGG